MRVMEILTLVLHGSFCASSEMCIIDGPAVGGGTRYGEVGVDTVKKYIDMDLHIKNRVYITKNDEIIRFFSQRLAVPASHRDHDGTSRSMGLPLVCRVIIFTNGEKCDCFTINDSKQIGYMSLPKDIAFNFIKYNDGYLPDDVAISVEKCREIINVSDYIFKISRPDAGK